MSTAATLEPTPVQAAKRPPVELLWALLATAAFHLAYEVPALALLMLVYLYALVRLTQTQTARRAFYWGLAVGLACFVPQLWFFLGIFHAAALALWLVGAIWIAFFVLLLATVWMGLEYFRSELYYLKFAWLTPGIALGSDSLVGSSLVSLVGVYGAGFVVTAFSAAFSISTCRKAGVILGILGALVSFGTFVIPTMYSGPALRVIAIQLESPTETQILEALDKAIASDPDREYGIRSLLVMSEYTLATPPTQRIRDWCRDNRYYLLVGGIQPLNPAPDGKERWADTAFVVDPKGNIVFTQGKCVPIQFFDDGEPATEQKIWESPWGSIGICICYDLSYSRVTDQLIDQGANALIVIAMDSMSWGEHEHNLHARIAPARAVEYHLDILRVASSGVTQHAYRHGGGGSGTLIPFPQQDASKFVTMDTRTYPRLPPDRLLAPLCVAATGLIILTLLGRKPAQRLLNWRKDRWNKRFPGLRD